MPTADRTNFGRRLKTTDTDDVLSVPFGFVRGRPAVQHLVKFIPAHFTNRAGKVWVLHHSASVQGFQTNRIVLLAYRTGPPGGGYFVQEVLALDGICSKMRYAGNLLR